MRGGKMRQSNVDKFIRKIQLKSRVAVEDKIIFIKPASGTVTFNMKPSKWRTPA